MYDHCFRIFLLLCLGAMLPACGSPEPDGALDPEAASPPTATPGLTGTHQAKGTIRMVKELDRIYRSTLEHPAGYYYLNTLHAGRLEQEIERLGNREEGRRLRYAYGVELLNAGRTEAAIETMERLLKETKDEGAGIMSPGVKQLHETLAIAYLRLGEQQNCILNHAAESCILPLQGDGIHTLREGSQRAAGLYGKLLASFSRDYELRWLLNVAQMTLAGYPDRVPPDLVIPGLTAGADPTVPRFRNVATALGVGVRGLAGGVSIEDFNNDGLLDLLTTAYRLNDPVQLFLYDNRGGYTDATETAGLAGLSGGLNTVHADYDNDGSTDVLILRGAWLGANGAHPNSLLKNNGDGTFEDVTDTAGLLSHHPTQTAAWGDFNNDGLLDLFVGNEAGNQWLASWQTASADAAWQRHPCELYMNNGDGTFTEVAARVGVELEAFVKGAAWGDVNNDGLPDLYVSVIGGPNRLFINLGGTDGADWRFEEAAARAGVHEPFFGFPVWFWDYNNDGWEDLFVAAYDLRRIADAASEVAREYLGLPVESERPRLYRNNGDGTFTDATEAAGLDVVLFAMGAGFGDLDNDGYEDFYVGTGTPDLRAVIPNRMFRNQAGRRFRDVTFEGGFGHLQKGHAIAFADLDRDGDQDLYTVMGGVFEGDVFQNALFENPGPATPNAWVTLRLEGRRANRSAIGARIGVTVVNRDGSRRTFHRTVTTGGSFGASSLQQEIGLGPADHIAALKVTWPNRERTVDTFTNLAVNQSYHLVEGSPIEAMNAQAVPFRTSPHEGHTPQAASSPGR